MKYIAITAIAIASASSLIACSRQEVSFDTLELARAPHGKRVFTERIAAWVKPSQKRKFNKRGGSEWLRKIVEEAA